MSVKLKRSMSFVLALLLCAAAFFTVLPAKAFAAGNTVKFEPGYSIPYGNYSTTKMSIDGGTGIAYCAEPYKKTPMAGTHSFEYLGTDSPLRKALYYLQGGPGYEQIRGAYLSGWSEDNAYVIGHLVVSFINDGCSTAGDAFYGAPENYKNKAIEVANAIRGLADPSDDFKAFIVAGNGGAQAMVGTWFQRYGWIELNKKSANPSVTDGNSSYSLKGAKYGIYSGATLVEMLTTDDNGYAKSGQLKTGNYTVREISPSVGYQIDTAGYDVEVTADAGAKVTSTEQPSLGWMEMTKSTADAKITDQNDNYSLEGAEYQLFRGDALVKTLVTDANGYAKAENLPLGDYTLKESKESKGYKLDLEAHGVTVTADAGAKVNVTEVPQSGWIELKKSTANPNVSEGNENYSLKGAEYGVFMGERQVATLVTDENGYAKSEAIGIGDYTVKELKASAGYAIDSKGHNVTVTDDQTSIVEVQEVPQNYLTDILVQKTDKETGKAEPQGAASLADAEFTVKYYEEVSDTDPAADGKEAVRTWILKTDDKAQAKLDADHLVSGDALYTDTRGNNCLPIGTITIQETKAPEGYLADEETFVIKLAEGGEKETIATVNTSTAPEQIYRGDLEFVKVSDGDLARLAGVPFTITSKTTGESHTIVTDENGYASTASSWVKHTANTNAGKTSADGIWFGTSDPDDSKGALLYDTYVIEEQRCEANKGMDLLKIEVSIHRDSVTVQMGTLTDDRIEIGTTALDEASGTHYAKPEKEVTIVDTVSYEGLKKGQEYKLAGKLMDQETGEVLKDKDGKEITAETTFKAKKSKGTAEVKFTFDASSMAGKSTVVFEDLYYGDLLLTTHADLEDQDQTVHFPEIGTTAANDKTGDHTAFAEKKVTLTDLVSYKGLVPGETYTVTGTLMDRETGKAVTVDGDKIMAETEFTPEKSEGTVELHFTFDGSSLAGKTVVAFESVKTEDKEIAVHADLEDEEQTIYFPGIRTTAKDKADNDQEVEADSDVTIIDTVSYSNLTAGETYHVTGTLMDQETGKAIRKDGKDVTAEAEFTAEKTEGTVEVEFTFNTKDLDGHSVVVFEEMTNAKTGAVIATHKDLKDKDQTITVKEKPETPEQPKSEKPETPSGDTPKSDSPKGTTVTTDSPKTGDDSHMILWAVIAGGALLAGAGLAGSQICRRKKKNG